METIEGNYCEHVLNAPPDHVLSLEQASQYLGVSQAAIRTWKRNGKAPAFFRAGKLLRFRPPYPLSGPPLPSLGQQFRPPHTKAPRRVEGCVNKP
jgi:hypothetical protein